MQQSSERELPNEIVSFDELIGKLSLATEQGWGEAHYLQLLSPLRHGQVFSLVHSWDELALALNTLPSDRILRAAFLELFYSESFKSDEASSSSRGFFERDRMPSIIAFFHELVSDLGQLAERLAQLPEDDRSAFMCVLPITPEVGNLIQGHGRINALMANCSTEAADIAIAGEEPARLRELWDYDALRGIMISDTLSDAGKLVLLEKLGQVHLRSIISTSEKLQEIQHLMPDAVHTHFMSIHGGVVERDYCAPGPA